MKTKTLTIDEATYTVREVPASFLRLHDNVDSGAARMDMLGACVLGSKGQPLGKDVDDIVPLRHVARLISEIIELSDLVGNGDAPD